MPEYNIEFAQQMSAASIALLSRSAHSIEADRAALYISLVACEVALKAALERAGKPLTKIRRHSHKLSKLLDEVSACTVLVQITPNNIKRVPASRIRSIVVDTNYADATIGKLLHCEKYGASEFPNEIRYGDSLKHFPSSVMAKLSEKVVEWVKLHFDNIQA